MMPLLQFSLVAFTSIFVLVDPIAAIPAFLAMTDGSDRMLRRHMAVRAAATCFVVLVTFSVAGNRSDSGGALVKVTGTPSAPDPG